MRKQLTVILLSALILSGCASGRMGNLSQGIKEQAYVEGTENGIAIGKQEGITIGKREGIAETIVKMYRKGYEAEQISDILDMEVEEVREIIENE